MKYILSLLVICIVYQSCSNSNSSSSEKSIDDIIANGNLGMLKAKRTEVLSAYEAITKDLNRLEAAIAAQDDSNNYPLITTYVVKDTLFKHYIDIQGNVETNQNILIYPEFQGVLSKIYVKEGQHVAKGQLLAQIDDGGLSSRLAQLQTQYKLAKTTFERQQRLWEQNIGSEIQFLQAKTNMEAAKSAVDQVQSQINKTFVNAPFSGEIDEIITDQGQVVGPGGAALMRIVNLNNMHIKAAVPESYLTSVTKNTAVKVMFPALNKTFMSKVNTVGHYINPNNRTFDIEIKIPNTDTAIKPNLIAKLEINDYTADNSKLIPSNIIQENSRGETYVFAVEMNNNNKAQVKRIPITTGKKYNGFIEVLSGLKNGDRIVKDGALSLLDGNIVTIKQ